jgi:cytochrome c oxidase subunit 2
MWKDFPLLPENASSMATQIDMVWWFLVALTVVMTVGIFAAVVSFAVWFRKKNDGRVATQIVGSTQLEILWSGIPFLIVMGLFGWGTAVYVNTQRTPETVDIDMYVVGKQWMWKIQHPTGQREINAMHVPVGKVVRITQTSEDVIHSFFVPAFRMKKDAVPGRYSQQWFEATKVGTYHLFCAEYCGSKHAQMVGWVTVMEQDEYQRWLANTTPSEVPEEAGRKLFEAMRCISCHPTAPGVSQIDGAAARGPSMVDLYGREVALKDGRRIRVDDEYIRESILNPMAKITAGYEPNMPTYEGQLGEDQILQLITYIKSLKSTGTKQ